MRPADGPICATVVKTLLARVIDSTFFFMRTSQSFPEAKDIIHITRYGNDDNNPFCKKIINRLHRYKSFCPNIWKILISSSFCLVVNQFSYAFFLTSNALCYEFNCGILTASMEYLSTSFMYLGRSVTMVKKHQSWPICAQTNANNGSDVKIWRHGGEGLSWKQYRY